MKKTTDEELNAWRYFSPSAIVSPTIIGDEAYAYTFMGVAYNLLYQVKNRMRLGGLKQLQRIQPYSDGTIITVGSVFGQDSIEINVSQAKGIPSCTIILINVPKEIPPMRRYLSGETFTKTGGAWVIKAPNGTTEIEGIDYIKTYYTLSINCPTCSPLSFTVCDTNGLGSDSGFSGGTLCHPFTYGAKDEMGVPILYQKTLVPYNMGNPLAVPPIPPNPKNHIIYSLWGSGQAEILKFDGDQGGSYFLWKAYTEWTSADPTIVTFSRTGLGYMLLQGFINNGVVRLCESVPTVVKVDCCLKKVEDRPLVLYWESLPPFPSTCVGQPFFYYGDAAWCEVPPAVPFALIADLFVGHYVGFWVFPERNGNCIPIIWTLSGPGSLVVSDDTGMAEWFPPDHDVNKLTCNDKITVTATDRCGTSDNLVTLSCCEAFADTEMEILYTSLLMMCNAIQDMMITGGCAPFTITISGGGSITGGGSSSGFTYHAPATNPNCTSNPTITVTDCCGKTASVSLAVNCYTGGAALSYGTYERCGSCWCFNTGCNQGFRECVNYIHYGYNCNGDQTCTGESAPCDSRCTDPPGQGEQYPYYVPATCGQSPFISWPPTSCYVGCAPGIGPCNTLVDDRTAAMKTNGCCPLNPLTGLPF